MADPAGTPRSIASAYKACMECFYPPCFVGESTPGCDVSMSDELARFRIWAANCGAHHPAHFRYSLDYRLRGLSHAKRLILQGLERLQFFLQQALDENERKGRDEAVEESSEQEPDMAPRQLQVESSIGSTGGDQDDDDDDDDDGDDGDDDDGDDGDDADSVDSEAATADTTNPGGGGRIDDIYVNIRTMITLLYRILIAIRPPRRHDRSQDYSELDLHHWEQYDYRHVSDKFPSAADDHQFLLARLAWANTERRKFFQYQKAHREKLARAPQQIEMGGEDAKSISLESANRAAAEGTILTKVSTLLDPPLAQIPDSSHDHADVFGLETAEVGSDAGCSQTSYTPTSVSSQSTGGHKLSVPPPPNATRAYGGEPFECPYCRYPVIVSDFRSWQHHVFKDLRPYVCTFAECTTANEMFPTLREWFAHELRLHRKEWYCNDCDSAFATEQDILDHLHQTHPDTCNTVLLPIILTGCSRVPKLDQQCPLCAGTFSASKIKNHVARHLQQLALYALPWRDDLEDVSGDDNENVSGDDIEGTSGGDPEEVSGDDLEGVSGDGNPAAAMGAQKPSPAPQAILIAVVGVTGVGKSSFIRKITNDPKIQVGGTFTACTKAVELSTIIYETDSKKYDIQLLDTPGFDEVRYDESEVLTELENWLKLQPRHEQKLSGIIYMRSITDIYTRRSGQRNFQMLQNLCGNQSLNNVLLVTNRWEMLWDQAVGARRVDELLGTGGFWRSLVDHGARHMPYDGTPEKAQAIINAMIASDAAVQEQLASGSAPADTAASREQTA